MYQLDANWQTLVEEYDIAIKSDGLDSILVKMAAQMNSVGSMFSGLTVVGTFAYLFKQLRS